MCFKMRADLVVVLAGLLLLLLLLFLLLLLLLPYTLLQRLHSLDLHVSECGFQLWVHLY